MKAILRKLTVYVSAILTSLFPAFGKQVKRIKTEHRQNVSNEIYKNTLALLKGETDFPGYRPLYGKELKMLHRRLKQYQRISWRASRLQREEALRKLQKEWKRVLRNRMRTIKGERGNYPYSLGFGEGSVERSKE